MCIPLLAAAGAASAATAATVGVAATTAATVGTTAAAAGGMFGGMSGLQMLSTGLSMVGQIMKGQAEQDQLKVQAQVAENNKTIATANAADATRRAELEAQRVQRNASSMAGSQRAAFAAKGLDVSDGTTGDIIDQTNFFGQIDANTARYNGKVESWRSLQQASNYGTQASASRSTADSLSAGSMLSGAGAVADKWYSYNKKAA